MAHRAGEVTQRQEIDRARRRLTVAIEKLHREQLPESYLRWVWEKLGDLTGAIDDAINGARREEYRRP